MHASHYYRVRLHGDFSAVRLQGCWAFSQAQLRSGSSEGFEEVAVVGSAAALAQAEMAAVSLAMVEIAVGLAALGDGGDGGRPRT